MASQSSSSQSPPDDNSQSTGSKIPKPMVLDANQEHANDSSGRPLFATLEPLREDQVQNAVKFLSHPKVRGSPVIYRRSFLEKKGLTKEEIDEAFRRVPDPPSSTTVVETSTTNPAKSSATLQSQAPSQTPQPSIATINGVSVAPSIQQPRFKWSQAILAAGLLAASGTGATLLFKNVIVPRLKGWIRDVASGGNDSEKEDKLSSNLAEETAEAAKAAATAAAVVAKASEELLSAKIEEKKYFEALLGALDVQVKEMKSMGEAIRRLEIRREDGFSEDKLTGEHIQSTTGNGTINNSWRTQIMGSAQRVDKPPGIKPWEASQQAQQRRSSYGNQSQSSDEVLGSDLQENFGSYSQMNGKAHDSSEPWWRKKSVKITEIDSEMAEPRQFAYGIEATEKPKQRAWVPPQPPSVVMPEAAAAIRKPKSSAQKQPSGDERSVVSSDDGEDGMMGSMNSVVEVDNSGSMPVDTNQSEIQEEREDGIEAS